MTEPATETEEALSRLERFAKGERMQDVWSGDYLPDLIRADLIALLADSPESGT